MSTITTNKKPVAPNWQTAQVQTEVVKSVATIYASLETVLAKASPEIAAEAAKIVLINKGYYANLPIKSPLDLVNAVAEYTANVLGIKVAIVGDADKPLIIFEGGTLANKLAAVISLAPSQVPTLIDYFKKGFGELGAQFGYKTEITSAEPDFIVSFSK